MLRHAAQAAGSSSCEEAHVWPSLLGPEQKSLPFIYKLLEIWRENSIRQLGRWLRRKEGVSASLCVNGSKKEHPLWSVRRCRKLCSAALLLPPPPPLSLPTPAGSKLQPQHDVQREGPHAESLLDLRHPNCSTAIVDPTLRISAQSTPTPDKAAPEASTEGQLPPP